MVCHEVDFDVCIEGHLPSGLYNARYSSRDYGIYNLDPDDAIVAMAHWMYGMNREMVLSVVWDVQAFPRDISRLPTKFE